MVLALEYCDAAAQGGSSLHSPGPWLDIASPVLIGIHEVWIKLRGVELLPPANAYNAFVAAVRPECSLCAIWPPTASEPSYRSIGADIAVLAPKLAVGVAFSSVESALVRSIWGAPLQRAMETLAPESSTVKLHRKGNVEMFESLVLPFAVRGKRAGLAHAVYDLSTLAAGPA